MVGPFDFEVKRSAEERYGKLWRFRICPDNWERLQEIGTAWGLNTSDVKQQAIVCLGTKPK